LASLPPPAEIDLNLAGFTAALFLALTVVPFIGAPRNDSAYWAFNHDLWVAAAYGLIGQVILGGGVMPLLVTVDYLFQTKLDDAHYDDVVALLLVGPAVWLAMAPRPPSVGDLRSLREAGPRDRPNLDTVFQGVILIVRYLLIPLVLAYTVILHAYAAKIGIAFELPRGKIGWLVSGFVAAAVLTALLAWPVRHSGGALVQFFWRYWFALTVVPLALLAIGTATRIETYNLTASRYLLVLIGLWIAILAVVFSLGERWRDLRLITGTLFAFVLLTMAGPPSITGLPARFLAAEMPMTLAGAGLIDEAGHIRATPADVGDLDEQQKARVGSLIQALRETGELDVLEPLAAGELAEAFEQHDAGARQGPVRARAGGRGRDCPGASLPDRPAGIGTELVLAVLGADRRHHNWRR